MQASYVAPLSSDNDEDAVASDIAAFVADQMPAGTAKVVVYPAPGNDTLVPKLLPALQAQGLVVEAGKNASASDVYQLRYQVDPLEQGELVRIEPRSKHCCATSDTSRSAARLSRQGRSLSAWWLLSEQQYRSVAATTEKGTWRPAVKQLADMDRRRHDWRSGCCDRLES